MEQPLPVEEQPVPAPPAAEAGGFLSSLRSFGGGIVTKGREILSVALRVSVPCPRWLTEQLPRYTMHSPMCGNLQCVLVSVSATPSLPL